MDHIFSLIDELVKGDSHAQRELAAARLRGILSGVLNQAPEPPPEPKQEAAEADEAAAKRHAAMEAERLATPVGAKFATGGVVSAPPAVVGE